MLDRADLDRRIEALQGTLDELRQPRPSDRHLGSIVVTDLIDRCGHYLYIDPWAEELLGFPPRYYEAELDWLAFNHHDDQDHTRALWSQALGGRFCPVVYYRTDDSNGAWVWLEDSFRPRLADHRGRVVVLEGRWRDVTPRKRLEIETRIRELERFLGSAPSAARHRFGLILPFPGRSRPTASVRPGRSASRPPRRPRRT